jgi:TetR/AcrR family transcriptional repressor of nem operon
MRYSKEHKQKTHIQITEAASSRFRERGIDGIGVAGLMQSLGLTHGGFYAHFESKDALVAEAVDSAFDQTIQGLRAYAEAAERGQHLARLVAAYISAGHRDSPGQGCMAAALSSELRRQSDAVREVTSRRLDDLLALIDEMARNDGLQVSAPAALALMVGAVSLSRIPKDAARAESYLDAARLLMSQVATPQPAVLTG